jgi:type II secretory pathway pseudopilin PulG
MLRRRQTRRGDTLIEVLFAVSVFSLVVVSALALMNQGTAASQRSLEMTIVRQQMDNQADTLRFLHAAYVQAYYSGIDLSAAPESPAKEYYKVTRQAAANTAGASAFGSVRCGTPPEHSFILDTSRGTIVDDSTIFKKPDTFAQLVYNGSGTLVSSNGLWIEGVRTNPSSGANAGYIDFHIRACWDTLGMSVPMNLGTIVRLYEPRG